MAPARALHFLLLGVGSLEGCGRSAGCTKDGDCKGDRVCNLGVCQDPPPKRAPTAEPSVARGPAPIAAREIPAGWTEGNDRWLPRFSASRGDDAGLSFVAAAGRCRARGLSPCTASQVERACATDPAFGDAPSWTASPAPGGVLVVGPGCAARRVVSPADVAPGRAAPCCGRAIALATDGRAAGWLESTEEKLQAFERAQARGAAELRALLAPTVAVHGLSLAAPLVAEKWVAPPPAVAILDVCKLSAELATDTWTAECARLRIAGPAVEGAATRFVWSGERGVVVRLQDVTPPADPKDSAGQGLERPPAAR